MTGRPSGYSEETAQRICEGIASGKSLRQVCEPKSMPARSAVMKWLTEHDAFADQYACAREVQADAVFDEMLSIADTGNSEDVQRAKLRVDTRKWMLARMAPKKYGERISAELTGKDGEPLAPDATAVAARLAAILEAAERRKAEAEGEA